MCINKETFKCCGNISLTHATIGLGVTYLVFAVIVAVSNYWFSFCMCLITSGLFIAVCYKKKDVKIRK